jgi:recombination protein RecA
MAIDDLIGGTLSADKSGPKCPGYPRRKITEIYGAESSGKTTAAIQAVAAVQKQGGTAMFLDFEHALDHQYAQRIGMSFDQGKLALFAPESLEQGWKMINIGIRAGVDIIVIDSVASMVPQAELDKPPGDAARIGAVAAAMSSTLPKIIGWLCSQDPQYNRNPLGTALLFLNQIRATIQTGGHGGGGGEGDNTSGGKALKYYAHLRVKFTRLRSDSVTRKDPMTGKEHKYNYGNHTQVKLVKSRVDGKQGFTTDIFIRYNYGIDDYFSLIEAGVSNKLISKGGAFYEYAGEKFQGRDRIRQYFLDNPKQFAELRAKILKSIRDDDVDTSTEEQVEDQIFAALDSGSIIETGPEDVDAVDDLDVETVVPDEENIEDDFELPAENETGEE